MGTSIRPEISKKHDYYISKHRYYELKHFCLQYDEWVYELNNLTYLKGHHYSNLSLTNVQINSDYTSLLAMDEMILTNKIKMIRSTAYDVDKELGDYIFKAVIKGYSYEYLKTNLQIPASRDMYYNRYRKFFYLLHKRRN